ncbi:hypothetical protein [Wolbachia endosymbiont (group A) of Myopa testacea]|uniref:hypothetical protein n=1 Tax=Wolbachia endosymbiont (group A) of Myopa testacea TaxID=3066148 RepID=UPI003341495A
MGNSKIFNKISCQEYHNRVDVSFKILQKFTVKKLEAELFLIHLFETFDNVLELKKERCIFLLTCLCTMVITKELVSNGYKIWLR